MKRDCSTCLWSFDFIYMLVLNAFMYMAFFMTMPIVSPYAYELGAALGLAGLIAGANSLTSLAMRPLSGRLTDTYHGRMLLFCAAVLSGVSCLGCSLVANLVLLVALRILQGVSFAIFTTASAVMASRIISRQRLAEGMGWFGLALVLANGVAPFISANLGRAFGYRASFALAAAMSAGAVLMALLMKRPKAAGDDCSDTSVGAALAAVVEEDAGSAKAAEESDGQAGPARLRSTIEKCVCLRALPLSLIAGCCSGAGGTVLGFIVLIGESRGIAGLSFYYVVYALALLVFRPLAGKIYDKRGLSYVFYPACAALALALMILSTAQSLLLLSIAAALHAFGQGSINTAMQTSCIKLSDDGRTGAASGTYFIGPDIGNGIGPAIGGALAGACGYSVMLWVGGFFVAAVLILYALLAAYLRRALPSQFKSALWMEK